MITFERFVESAGVGVTMTQARPGAEMTGHEFDGFFTIGDRLFAVIEQIMGDGALVVGFGELGVERNGAGEVIDRLIHFAAIHGLCAAAQLFIGLGASAAEPDGPESVLSHFIDDGIWVFELFGQRGKTTCATHET